ncbi:hypothetical protein PGIGA_G00230070, partial [Pangasianodon gigas]|nr:hypothetical protein [Pangasianodon gigas]
MRVDNRKKKKKNHHQHATPRHATHSEPQQHRVSTHRGREERSRAGPAGEHFYRKCGIILFEEKKRLEYTHTRIHEHAHARERERDREREGERERHTHTQEETVSTRILNNKLNGFSLPKTRVNVCAT